MSFIIQDIIIPDKSSECPAWISYFDQLKKRFGETNARVIWLRTWQAGGNTGCTARPEFAEFVKKHQIDVSNALTGAIAGISQIGGNIMDLGKGISSTVAIGIPVALGAVFLVIIILLVRASGVKPSDAMLLTPQGRMAKLTGLIK